MRGPLIIHGDQVFGMPYDSLGPCSYHTLNVYTKEGQRKTKTFFDGVCQETSCLNHLLPDKRDPRAISKMRHPTWYPIPYNRRLLNVISLSYIMPAVIANTIIFCVLCVDL